MNDAFAALGMLHWKPLLSGLLLPPASLLLLLLLGMRLRRSAVGLGTLLVALAVAGLWLSHCEAVGTWLERQVLKPPPPLSTERLAQWRRTAAGRQALVLVLGGGRRGLAPAYGESDLSSDSHQRLRYALWLSRQLNNAPVMYSGGVGHGQLEGPPEAEIALRLAQRDYGRPLRWLESESRNTRENARLSLMLIAGGKAGNPGLAPGLTDLFVVTHGWHMPRALRAFEEEAARQQLLVHVIAAPMGLAAPDQLVWLRWLPSVDGYRRVHNSLHELAGLVTGA